VCLQTNEIFINNFSEDHIPQYQQQGFGRFQKLKDNINRTKTDKKIRAISFIPIKTKDKDAGVISFQITKNKFTDLQQKNCISLAKFIATTIEGEFHELDVLKESLKKITDINYNNLTEKNYKEKTKPLFPVIYELLFGMDSKKDLFAIAFWIKEEKKNDAEIPKDFYTSPRLKDKNFKDYQSHILAQYSCEMLENSHERNDRKIISLHDYSSYPAVFYFVKNQVDISNDYNNIEILEYNNWKGDIKEYKEYIEQITRISKMEIYENFVKNEYIEPLPEEVFLKSASNGGLNTNSLLFYPIIAENEVKGVLSFQHKKPYYFTETHRKILKIIANLIGIAIQKENARNNFFNVIGNIITHRCNTYVDGLLRDAVTLETLRYEDTYFRDIDIAKCTSRSAKSNVKTFAEILKTGEFREKFVYQTFLDETYNTILKRIRTAATQYQKATYFFDKDKLTEKKKINLKSCIYSQIQRIEDKIESKYKGDKNEISKWKRIRFNINNIRPDLLIETSELVLEEIFYNLMINTFEHAFDPKKEYEKIDVQIDCQESKKNINIVYSNTGNLIKEESGNINWIFDFESSSKSQGGIKGIGLYGIDYLLTTYLNGNIEVKNEQNRVIFTINIKLK